jgi:hypothetical protein
LIERVRSSGSIDSVRLASLDPEVKENYASAPLATVARYWPLCCALAVRQLQVEFMDQLVAQGDAKSRAAAVTRALGLDGRRRMAERDAAIYTSGKDPDMDRLAAWVAKNVDLSDLD